MPVYEIRPMVWPRDKEQDTWHEWRDFQTADHVSDRIREKSLPLKQLSDNLWLTKCGEFQIREKGKDMIDPMKSQIAPFSLDELELAQKMIAGEKYSTVDEVCAKLRVKLQQENFN